MNENIFDDRHEDICEEEKNIKSENINEKGINEKIRFFTIRWWGLGYNKAELDNERVHIQGVKRTIFDSEYEDISKLVYGFCFSAYAYIILALTPVMIALAFIGDVEELFRAVIVNAVVVMAVFFRLKITFYTKDGRKKKLRFLNYFKYNKVMQTCYKAGVKVQKRKSGAWTFAVAAVMLVLAIGGWFVYHNYIDDSENYPTNEYISSTYDEAETQTKNQPWHWHDNEDTYNADTGHAAYEYSGESPTQPASYTGQRRFSDTIDLYEIVNNASTMNEIWEIFTDMDIESPELCIENGHCNGYKSDSIRIQFFDDSLEIDLSGYVYKDDWDYVYDVRVLDMYLNMSRAEVISILQADGADVDEGEIGAYQKYVTGTWSNALAVAYFTDDLLTEITLDIMYTQEPIELKDYMAEDISERTRFFIDYNIPYITDGYWWGNEAVSDTVYMSYSDDTKYITATLSGDVYDADGNLLDVALAGIKIGMTKEQAMEINDFLPMEDNDGTLFWHDIHYTYMVTVSLDGNDRVSTIQVQYK